jgi:hypothetical protein
MVHGMDLMRGMALAVLLACGCTGPSSSSSSSSGSSSGSNPEVIQAYVRYLMASCDLEQRCGAQLGQLYASDADCRDTANGFGEAYANYYGAYFDAYMVDQAALDACITHLGTEACDQVTGYGGACQNFLVPRNPQPAGSRCGGIGGGVCGQGTYCDYSGVSACNICKTSVAIGGACSSSSECASSSCENNVCTAAATTALPRLGEPCPNNSCYGSLECKGSGAAARCVSRVNVGEPCGGANPNCLTPLQCDTAGTCQRPLANGQPCTRNPPEGSITCRNTCRFATPDAATGTCGPNFPLPGIGEPCPSNLACARDAYAQEGANPAPSCVCAARLPDGAACRTNACQNSCLDGVCGTPGPTGSPCSSSSACANDTCGLRAGDSQPSCMAAVCAPPTVACTPAPTNTNPDQPLVLAPNVAAAGTYCTGSMATYYWQLPGPFPAGTLVEFLVSPDGSGDGVDMRFEQDQGSGFTTVGSCYPSGSTLSHCTVTPQSTGPVRLSVASFQSTPQNQAWVMLYRTVADGEGGCSQQPTNISQATAATLQSGVPTSGTFCSRGTAVEYWWRLSGDFAAGDVVRLDATAQTLGYQSLGLNLGVYDALSNRLDTLEYCYAYASSVTSCYALMEQPATDIYVVTNANPSIRRNEPVTITLQEVTPPAPACPNPPANRASTAAIPFTLGTPVDGRFCNSVLNQEYWWRATGIFTSTQTCRLVVTFDNGGSASDVDFQLRQPDNAGGFYTIAYCSAGSGQPEDCDGGLFLDGSELYVVTNSNPRSSNVDESFSFTVTCN